MADLKGGDLSFSEKVKRVMAPMSKSVKLWENARFVLADVPLNKREANKILPLAMWPSDPPTATLFIVDYTKTSFTVPYKEAAILIHVKTPLGSGLHCPWMIVDDDTGLIYGRELLGYPKKAGQFTFVEEGNRVSASISRRGVEVLKMEAELKEPENPPSPVFDYKTFNVGGPGQMFIFQPIWLFRPKEVIHESRMADVKVTLGDSELDPISRLVAGSPTRGRFVAMDILGSKYNLLVGAAGPGWFLNTYNMRYK